jgi:hypothetical protein
MNFSLSGFLNILRHNVLYFTSGHDLTACWLDTQSITESPDKFGDAINTEPVR